MDNETTGEGEPLPGTPYRLLHLLGEGAHGRVYLGEHVELGTRVVVKLIQQKYAARSEVVGRLRREARILARISHKALTEIRDLGTATDGRTFFVMNWVEGVSLREALRTRGSLPIVEAGPLLIEALGGLQAAHEQGIIHRDLKPENFLLTSTGNLKILDFGIAKVIQETEGTGTRTANGMVLGTPRYMPPEQAKGSPLSPATDVYNMGLVLFELIAGTPAFDGETAQDLIYAHVQNPPPTLSARLQVEVDAELESVIARSLQKEPSARFTTADEMARALQRVVDRLKLRMTPAPAPRAKADPDRTDIDPIFDQQTRLGESSASSDAARTRPISAAALVMGSATTDHAPARLQPVGHPIAQHRRPGSLYR